MEFMEIGRVCLKTAGREAGKYCVIVNTVDKDFVLVTGPKAVTQVKRRKCNVRHLEPLPLKVEIKGDASDSDVTKELEKGGILEKLRLSKPSAEQMKMAEERRAASEERRKAEESMPKAEAKEEVAAKPKKVSKPKAEKAEKAAAKPKAAKPKKAGKQAD
jgi:large subunit ribosomal protein L14e